MTLSPIHWVPVQDKGSKILCVKFGAMKIIPSDRLHQEYLTINLGNTSDWRQLQLPLVRLCEIWRGRSWATGADWGNADRGNVEWLWFNVECRQWNLNSSTVQFGAPLVPSQSFSGRKRKKPRTEKWNSGVPHGVVDKRVLDLAYSSSFEAQYLRIYFIMEQITNITSVLYWRKKPTHCVTGAILFLPLFPFHAFSSVLCILACKYPHYTQLPKFMQINIQRWKTI